MLLSYKHKNMTRSVNMSLKLKHESNFNYDNIKVMSTHIS